MTPLQEFKLKIIREFIDWNTNDEIDTNTRSLLFANAINFVENEDSGCNLFEKKDLENLTVIYDTLDSESELAYTMRKVIQLIQDQDFNPNDGLITWEYNSKNGVTDKQVIIRKATKEDQEGDCYDNVSQVITQLFSEGVIGFEIEEGLKWK